MTQVAIVGAGLSGLIAAHAWPNAVVFEREARPVQHHKALLRFRGEGVSALTGVEFRKVTVRKALWAGDGFAAPSIQHANSYSAKVIGRITNDRSIWNLDPVERWIAPGDFYAQLVQNVGSRIRWDFEFNFDDAPGARDIKIVSTIPLPVTLKKLGEEFGEDLTFVSSPITVRRYRVPNCDVFQTVYFPEPKLPLYRASITGDLLIAESIGAELGLDREAELLAAVFGLDGACVPLEHTKQRYGKIAPIPAANRRALLYRLTEQHGVYSLGRFATWRNVLLDDLVHDIAVVKKLMTGDHYASRIIAAG